MKVRFSDAFLASHRINQRERMQKYTRRCVSCDVRWSFHLCVSCLAVYVDSRKSEKATLSEVRLTTSEIIWNLRLTTLILLDKFVYLDLSVLSSKRSRKIVRLCGSRSSSARNEWNVLKFATSHSPWAYSREPWFSLTSFCSWFAEVLPWEPEVF